jgi:uncharacterized FlaG/YvyC family protein
VIPYISLSPKKGREARPGQREAKGIKRKQERKKRSKGIKRKQSQNKRELNKSVKTIMKNHNDHNKKLKSRYEKSLK